MGESLARVDAYIEKAADFAQPVLKHVRELYHRACPEIIETIKWGVPYFELEGMVGGMAAFKRHVSIGFWKAALLTDPEGLFRDGGSSMSAVKFSGLEDLPEDRVLIAYIREAVDLNKRGVKLPQKESSSAAGRTVTVPADLAAALAGNPAAGEAFEGFSYSNRKEYVDWINGAKQQATRDKRLAQAIEWMSQGRPRNWKYMDKYRK